MKICIWIVVLSPRHPHSMSIPLNMRELSAVINAMSIVTHSAMAPLKRILKSRQVPKMISNGGNVMALIAMNGSTRIL